MYISRDVTDRYKGKKIAIAGGRGYVGSRLASSLTEINCQVVLLDNSLTTDWMPESVVAEFRHIRGDLCTSSPWLDALPGTDILFHLAGLEYQRNGFNLKRDFESNVSSVVALLDACNISQCFPHVVFTSSINLYGATDNKTVTESTRDQPPSRWSAHKLLAENYLKISSKQDDLRSTILRLSNIYGVSARQETSYRVMVNRLIQYGLLNKKIYLYNNFACLRDFLFIDDAVSALLVAGVHKKIGREGDLYNVGLGESVSFSRTWEMIVNAIEHKTGDSVSIEIDEERELDILDYRSFAISTKKFRSCTGWIPNYNLLQGLDITVGNILNGETK